MEDSTATFAGPDMCYRLSLQRRIYATNNRVCLFIMLNPSTATAELDDPTIRRCKDFAAREGCGILQVVNLFALRATDPRALKRHEAPEGDPFNMSAILERAAKADVIICAWGRHGVLRNRAACVLASLRGLGFKLHALKLTADGIPCHPLYLRADTPLVAISE